jgi:hypothetical protein
VVTEPEELAEGLAILALCDRFHKLPSEILAEDAQLLVMLEMERRYSADG